jgi:hypothetical protein
MASRSAAFNAIYKVSVLRPASVLSTRTKLTIRPPAFTSSRKTRRR